MKPAREAYPITYGVLGLLAFCGAQSGYDLKLLFDQTMNTIWQVQHSQIYNELRRMERLGWVSMERQEQRTRPDKRVYRITAAGEAALRSWQAEQPAGSLQMRDETLLRFVFGSYAAPADLATTLRAAIVEHRARIEQYRINAGCIPPTPHARTAMPDPFFIRVTAFAIRFEETYLEWLEETLRWIEQRAERDTPPPDRAPDGPPKRR